MVHLLSITLPIFLVIGTGYIAARYLGLERVDLKGLTIFMWYFALPALVLRAFSQHKFEEFAHGDYLLAYAVGSFLCFFCIFMLTRVLRGKSQSESAVLALGVSASNSAYAGFPIAVLVVGPIAGIALVMNMLVETMMVIPVTLILATDTKSGLSPWHTALHSLKSLAATPMMYGLLLGAAMSALQIPFPSPLLRALDMIANASAAVALFIIGATLVGLKMAGRRRDVGQTVLGKLILHPTCVAIGLILVPGLDHELRRAAVLFAAAPMMTSYPVIAQKFGLQETSSASLMVATTMSFFTISALLMVL